MQRLRGLVVVMLAMAAAMSWSTAQAADPPAFSIEQLVYPGAKVGTRIEVGGAGATQLVGGALDAYAAELQEDLKAAREHGVEGGGLAEIEAALTAVESTREAIRSLLRIVLVVMETQEPVATNDLVGHYRGIMAPRGWSPLAIIQNEDEGENDAVMLMLAPGGKGIFAVVYDGDEIISGLVTTSKPLGDLLGKITGENAGSDPLDLVVGLATQVFGQSHSQAQPESPPAPEEPASAPSDEKE